MAWSSPRTWATSEVVTAAHMNQEVRDNLLAGFPDGADTADSWTPTLEATTANPSTSSAAGRQYQVGAVIDLWGRFVLSSAPTGRLFVTLPVSVVNLTAANTEGAGQAVGGFSAYDLSAGLVATGIVTLRAADEIQFQLGSKWDGSSLSDFVPWTWQSGDILSFFIRAPVA